MYWVNTLPGRRCLLASKPADLRDGEVICELAAMLLGPQFVPQPGDRLGTGVDKEYADAERLELALEALAKHADMPLGNRDPPSARGASGDGGGPTPGSSRRGLDRAETLVAVSAAAARIARGDLPATVRILSFMRDALGGENPAGGGGGTARPGTPTAKGTQALEVLSGRAASPVGSKAAMSRTSETLAALARDSNASPPRNRPDREEEVGPAAEVAGGFAESGPNRRRRGDPRGREPPSTPSGRRRGAPRRR